MSQNQNNPSVNLAKCPKTNPAFMVCLGQNCTQKAFICKDQNCECHTPHKLCLKLSLKNLQQTILVYSYSLEPLEKDISAVFDQAINYLSQQRDRVLKEIQEKFHYLGLNKLERKFIDVVKKGTNDAEINGQFVWKLHLGLKGQTKVKEGLDEISRQIKNIREDFDVEIKKFSGNFTKLLQQVKEKEEEIFLKSKIIKTIEEQNKLLAFFTDHKVIGAELLYRASENEFLASKWHEKCDHIPHTLTIIQNQHNKIFGGFTSFPWYTDKTSYHFPTYVNSKDHFIFSLTNNDKFTVTQNQQSCICIWGDNTYGPAFGGGWDLYIYDKANQNANSGNQIGYTYTNANYKHEDSASYAKFAGAQKYKIKEWQVWKIILK